MRARLRSSSFLRAVLPVILVGSAGIFSISSASSASTTPPTLVARTLLIGQGPSDPTTAAWEAALTKEQVPYTEVDGTGTSPSESIALPALSAGTTGNFNSVIFADDPADFTYGQLAALDTFESTFAIRQIDGYAFPTPLVGLTDATAGALDGTTPTLTTAGLAGLPALAGPIPMSTGTYGYGATVVASAPFTPWLENTAGNVLAGVYQHPGTDAQAGVSELVLTFDYAATDLQFELLAPGLVDWVTSDTHLGLNRNYVEVDIDDTFTPDNAWSTTVHDNDYSDADSLRMDPTDVVTAADWSNPTTENSPLVRATSEPSTPFRLDQLFNYGGTVEYQDGGLNLPGEPAACDTGNTADDGTCGPDPLLAQFQAVDPATGKPYSDDFGWLSHTYDTPYLDVGCASQNYIEAELNENTSESTAAPGPTPGTGGLGLTSSTNVDNTYGYYNPQVFVPGNHSGFADLDPGTPATVDPPDLDEITANATGGTLSSGTYEYAVTDQFNASDSTSVDQSQAYVTDGLQGDLAPVTVTGSGGSVAITWQAICHAANYIIYRAPVTAGVVGSWSQIGTYATPDSATLPDNSSGDTTPPQSATVCVGPSPDPTSCGGQAELTFTDTGTTGTAEPSGWTPPIVENANELPWEQNPYFNAALTAVGITTVGADASKAYPNPPETQFGIGASYTGATYAAGQPFVDGTAQVAPRHPINVFYNVATNAQELDEYNTLFDSNAPGSQCQNTTVTTCSTTPFTFLQVIQQVVSGMMQNVLSNDPETSYVHQTNLMGSPPYSTVWPAADYVPAATPQAGTDGDGTLYEVLNPLISEYDSYFNTNTPYEQLTLGGIGDVLAEQTAFSNAETAGTVVATETNGTVTVTNNGTTTLAVPATAPQATTTGGAAFGQSYGGELSAWTSLSPGQSLTLNENVAPAITSPSSATSIVGAAFNFMVTTTGEPDATLTETGALPTGLGFSDNGNATATISGTASSGTGGSYPITITATNASGAVQQSFTLGNDEAPTITSATSATFDAGVPGSYTVTTTGYPAPSTAETGALPTGVTYTDNGNGTATLAGTTTETGTYPISITATNASGSTATLPFTLTVATTGAPVITSGAAADFTLGTAGSFAVTASGTPTPAITESGVLPAGLSFVDNGNGTAILSGTPTATGSTVLTISASNSTGDPSAPLTVIVGQAPAFTSSQSTTFTAGDTGSFTVTTSGYPAPSLGESGSLPAGVTFVDNGDGTATISGTPAAGDSGPYPVNLTATNGTGSTGQAFTVNVGVGPVITSASSANFTLGTAGTFVVTTSGTPPPAITEIGALPAGLTFVDNGNGTATISGTPTATGSAALTISASSAMGDPSAPLTIIVSQAPAFTSSQTTTLTAGNAGSFTVTTTGYPAPSLSESGTLPPGVTFVDNADGTATVAGTPSAGDSGPYAVNLTATNATGSTGQAFTINVDVAPTITSAASAQFTSGKAGTFTVTTAGYPTPSLTESGALPAGMKFTANANGTATISGTAVSATQTTYPLTISASNGTSPSASQSFTIIVNVPTAPIITSASSVAGTAGTALSFTFTATGSPVPTVTRTSTLPAGLTFTSGTGSATLSGTPTAGGVSTITITAKNSVASTTQSFTITIAKAPAITSKSTATATVGTAFSFNVTSTGYPVPSITATGLPSGLSLVDKGTGTATISGTPPAGSGGTYPVSITSTSSLGTASQTLTITVRQTPVITSASSVAGTAGTALSFTFTATGSPVPTVTRTGTLPAGLTFTSGTGSATLSGTPTAGGVSTITITAKNSVASTTQSFTITIAKAPAITSKSTATATVGTAFSFNVTSTGYPVPSITATGLPSGLSLVDKGTGTATISGTPPAGSGGTYPVSITSTSSLGTASQTLTITVRETPVITSASSVTAPHGTPLSFTFTATGSPVPTVTRTGTLPAGLTFTSGTGKATLSGTPTTPGVSTITITAKNSVASTTQSFTITVS